MNQEYLPPERGEGGGGLKELRAQDGFTLAELTVSAGILVIITIIVVAVYFPIVRAQQRSIDFSRLQQEVQIILEQVAKDVRDSQIDYAYSGYGGTVDPMGEAELALKQSGGDYRVYCVSAQKVVVNRNTSPVTCSGGSALHASDITTTNLEFFILPSSDPAVPGAPDVRQPRVTIVLQARKTVGLNVTQVHLQTTVEQRLSQKQ